MLSGGWELEQSSYILGESRYFVTLVFFLLHDIHIDYNRDIMGNSGDVSQGCYGGGAPYCSPRGMRFN